MFNRKLDGCKNNSENSCTIKVGKQFPPGFSVSSISSFIYTEVQIA